MMQFKDSTKFYSVNGEGENSSNCNKSTTAHQDQQMDSSKGCREDGSDTKDSQASFDRLAQRVTCAYTNGESGFTGNITGQEDAMASQRAQIPQRNDAHRPIVE